MPPPSNIVLAVCTYNRCHLLERTLESIARQVVEPHIDWSVVVVDNCSTDGTRDVVEAWQARGSLPSLAYAYEAQPGVKFARQRAIRHTASPLIAFVDDDCVLAPNWIHEALTFMHAHPAAGAVGGRIDLEWEAPPSDFYRRYAGAYGFRDEGPLPLQLPASGTTYLGGAGLLLRRSAVDRSGWLDHGILAGRTQAKRLAGEDTELVLRIRRAGFELWYNPAMRLEHHVPSSSLTLEHLCALYRGIGAQGPVLTICAGHDRPEEVWGVGHALVATARYASRLVHGLLARLSRDGVAGERLAASHARGRFLGAWSFVFHHGRGRYLIARLPPVRTATR